MFWISCQALIEAAFKTFLKPFVQAPTAMTATCAPAHGGGEVNWALAHMYVICANYHELI